MDLIKRLEEATEGSRQMDAEIVAECRIAINARGNLLPAWVDANFRKWRARKDGHVEVVHANEVGGFHWVPLPYTTSIDAALALVPEGWFTNVACEDHNGRGWSWGLFSESGMVATAEWHATAPLALCIAALKARGVE